MAMLNVLEMTRRYHDEWVVLDRSLSVVDHGRDLQPLRDKYAPAHPHLTYYCVP